jgi:serine/threonine protein kinase
MKERGFERALAASPVPRPRERDAGSEKPTVVQAPLDLLANERSPRTLPKSSLHDALLELEQELDSIAGGEPPARFLGEERHPDGKLRRESDASTGGALPFGRAASGRAWRESPGAESDFDDLDDDDELGARLQSEELSHIGQVIDNRYLVEALIARGGMGVVYRCRHQVIGKRFAVKIIRSNMAHLADAPRRFLMEAKAASAIGNEHIINIFDYGTLADGSAYLVMELLDGMPLSDLIASHERLPTRRIVSIAMQVCEGLRAAHEAGIVHRDLKPENIFLVSRRSGDFIKILDFGIAKMSMLGEPMTKKGLIVGTPHYMSPEQAAGLPVDPRGDIYSLGIILYELATGRVPFDATHYMAVLAKHMTAPPPPFDTLGLEVQLPREFEAVVLMCLAKRPEERFQSMADLSDSLERLHRRIPPTAPLARERLPSVDLLSAPPPPPRETTRTAGSSLPAAVGQSRTAAPGRRDLGLAFFSVIVLGISMLSVWRMRSPEPSIQTAHVRAAPAPPHAASGSVPERTPPSSSSPARSLERNAERSAARKPLWPASPAAASAPGQSPAPPRMPPALSSGTTSAASAATAAELASQEPLTVVQLAPGKSVEIETRTRLSLRLSDETRALAEGQTSAANEPAKTTRRDRPSQTRKTSLGKTRHQGRPDSTPANAAEAPKDNGLMNPWHSPP